VVAAEEDEEMEREDERGVAKRPDLSELDVPEWAELALDGIERRELLQRIDDRDGSQRSLRQKESSQLLVQTSVNRESMSLLYNKPVLIVTCVPQVYLWEVS
jgi:hypothetical protein